MKTADRLDAALNWVEDRMRKEEQEERWQMELDGMLFTNHPGNIINKAKDMSPDVARYEHNSTLETMLMTLNSLDAARAELIRAIELVRKTR